MLHPLCGALYATFTADLLTCACGAADICDSRITKQESTQHEEYHNSPQGYAIRWNSSWTRTCSHSTGLHLCCKHQTWKCSSANIWLELPGSSLQTSLSWTVRHYQIPRSTFQATLSACVSPNPFCHQASIFHEVGLGKEHTMSHSRQACLIRIRMFRTWSRYATVSTISVLVFNKLIYWDFSSGVGCQWWVPRSFTRLCSEVCGLTH